MVLFYVALTAVVIATTFVHLLVSNEVPNGYMDEIFHIPQAQAYCAGNLTQWDPKITTLPGLYLLSAGLLFPFRTLGIGCTVSSLRFVNVVLNWLNLVVIYKICCIKFKDQSETNKILLALSLGLTPLLYFFSFLYYTDPASTFVVLLMHYFYLRKNYILSPLMGIVAIVMRQTNIVWLCWTACNVVWDCGEPTYMRLMQPLVSNPKKPRKKPPKKNKKKNQQKEQADQDDDESQSYQPIPLLNPKELEKAAVNLAKDVLPKASLYVVAFGMFVAFVILNGGIVVGDKEAHTATINLPQLFYFCLFSMTMGFAAFTHGAAQVIQSVRQHKITFVVAIIIGLVIVHLNTIAHPYLLADNRHYTFYVWKRLYESRPILKYVLVPIYIAFGFFVCNNLDLHPAVIFAFIIAVTVNSIPQKLLEFRYFLLPYLFLRLNMKPSPNYVLFVELIWAIVLNVFTIRKFLNSPFTWAHAPEETQRFMW